MAREKGRRQRANTQEMERTNKTKWDPPLYADATERRQSFVIKRYIPVDDLQRLVLLYLPLFFSFREGLSDRADFPLGSLYDR